MSTAVDPATLPTLYKIVGPAGEPLHGGSGLWPLPQAGQPGEWREVSGPVIPCSNGLHVTDLEHFEQWWPTSPTYGDAYPALHAVAYRVEVAGEVIDAGGKYACQRVRLLAWAAYLQAVSLSAIPLGHPARAYAVRVEAERKAAYLYAGKRNAATAAATAALKSAKAAARLAGV